MRGVYGSYSYSCMDRPADLLLPNEFFVPFLILADGQS